MVEAISVSAITKHPKFSEFSDREVEELFTEGQDVGLIPVNRTSEINGLFFY